MMDCGGKKPLIVYGVLLALQLGLVIALFYFAAQGKGHMDESEKGTDIPYYAGAFIVAAVNCCLVIFSILLVVFFVFDIDKGSGAILCTVCVFVYLAVPAFILGVIFITLFGISNCKKNENVSYDRNGFCSYETNIDNNYNTAVLCLIMTLMLFLTNIVHMYLLCKYDGDLEDDEVYITRGHTSRASGGGKSSLNTGRSSNSKGGNRTLRMMVRDRKIRNDEQKQRRMGVPEHKINKMFMPRY
ncbi:uncharacterized protein LOC132722442 [Ruditapes philippinarum]|uniref:uncharacterized protein LOC132722442 n=1 Tax=Ruditapes philippinarum TaxID=129788 RepID=UPI00295ABFB9|nr:uncharacterized protein LOC132722442 [Ruditapes philippinarum]